MLPLPPEPKLSSPGFDFASATRSAIDFTGSAAGTTATSGVTTTRATGTKSRAGSNARFLYSAGLALSMPRFPISSV